MYRLILSYLERLPVNQVLVSEKLLGRIQHKDVRGSA
jgi:hypothetical protein